MRRLLAIYGSPRKTGNSERLLDFFLEKIDITIWEVERLYLREMNFSYCTECGGCEKTGRCILQDDMQPVYEKLLSYERVVLSLPVFFLGPPSLAKAFIDRGQALWVKKYMLGEKQGQPGPARKGFLLSVCGFKGSEKIFSCNISIVKAFFAACGLKYAGEYLVDGVDHRGDVERRFPVVEKRLLELLSNFAQVTV